MRTSAELPPTTRGVDNCRASADSPRGIPDAPGFVAGRPVASGSPGRFPLLSRLHLQGLLQRARDLSHQADPDRALRRTLPFLLTPTLSACGRGEGVEERPSITAVPGETLTREEPDHARPNSTQAVEEHGGCNVVVAMAGNDLLNPGAGSDTVVVPGRNMPKFDFGSFAIESVRVNCLVIFLLGVCSYPGGAYAHSEEEDTNTGFYLGVGIGYAELSADACSQTISLPGGGEVTPQISCDNALGGHLFGGYNPIPYLGVEGGLLTLLAWDIEDDTAPETGSVDFGYSGYLAAVARLDLNAIIVDFPRITPFVKVGFSWWNIRREGIVVTAGQSASNHERFSNDFDGVDPVYGVGVDVGIGGHLAVRLEYLNMDMDVYDVDVGFISGLYRF